jgi:hypothetical protein
MAHKLNMRFTTAQEGKYFSLVINNIKEDANGQPTLAQTDISTLMDLIVQKNIFLSKSGVLVGKKDAKISSSSEQSFDLK